LDYSRLSAVKPRFIYAHASGFGEQGSEKNKPGFDGISYWARSGLMAGLALPGQQPVWMQYPALGDQVSGLVICGSVILVLFAREMTGNGQEVHFGQFLF
jgi:crotonobetainyl-CoA:carnitine CoA-transferase CaiB-like acyl-CoA transferase